MARAKAQTRIQVIREPETLQALSHPTRIELLEALREPQSAAGAARQLGQPRQRINHHLKALEEAGLIEEVGTRQQRNFTETLYRAKAQSFLVAPDATWADPRRLAALRKQHALRTLMGIGEKLQRDAVGLLTEAAFNDREIPSAAVTAEVRFASEADRAAFFADYVSAVRKIVEKYESRKGDGYRIVMVAHPESDAEEERSK